MTALEGRWHLKDNLLWWGYCDVLSLNSYWVFCMHISCDNYRHILQRRHSSMTEQIMKKRNRGTQRLFCVQYLFGRANIA